LNPITGSPTHPITRYYESMIRLAIVLMLLGGGATAFAEEPTISADLGACTADFKVTDAQEKPIYDAKVHVIIRYGFLAKRKTELEAATDSEGQVRFTGMPSDPKRDIVFDVRKDKLTQSVPYDPTANCHQHFDVKLK
jgi:hypothetical protein